MSRLTAAVLQMNSAADVDANLATVRGAAVEAAAAGVRLLVLPENFAFMGAHARDKLAIAEAPGDGPVQQCCTELAQRHGLWIVAGTIALRDPAEAQRIIAASLVYDAEGRVRARYDKAHLFDVELPEGSYRESATIAPGAATAVLSDGPAAARGGLSVCYDLRFPELYRRHAQEGACWLTVPSAFTHATGQAHWAPLLTARAIENQCFVLAPNQCGTHADGRSTWGHSAIIDPWGRWLAVCEEQPGLAIAELDFGAQAEQRRRFPVLAHRRIYT